MNLEAQKVFKYYNALGWSVIPINPENKLPLVAWKEFQSRYPTLEETDSWCERFPAMNYALITGTISNITVIDADLYKKKQIECPLYSPLTVTTPRGGQHFYYRFGGERPSVNADLATDIRGEAGYVLIPPSSISNVKYRWTTENPSNRILEALEGIPEDVSQLLKTGEKEKFNMSDSFGVNEGGRNIAAYKLACSLLNKMSEIEVWQNLVATTANYNPPLDEEEVKTAFESARQFIKSHPYSGKIIQTAVPKEIPIGELPAPHTMSEAGQEIIEDRKREIGAPHAGFPELTRLIKGFLPGHTYAMTGDTNVGKTSIACNFVERVRLQGKKSLYFALEPDMNVVEYMASCRMNKMFEQVTDKDLLFDDDMVHIYTKSDVKDLQTMVNIVANAKIDYSLIVIDHLGYFTQSQTNRTEEESNAIKTLAQLSKIKKVAILFITHVNKGATKGKYRPLTMDDMTGSAAKKQDSTEVFLIDRRQNEDGTLSKMGTLNVAKTKKGPNGIVKLIFNEKSAYVVSEEEVSMIAIYQKESNKQKLVTTLSESDIKEVVDLFTNVPIDNGDRVR